MANTLRTKTRWKIQPNQIILYPHGLAHIMALILALIFAAALVFGGRAGIDLSGSTIFAGLLLLAVVLVFAFGFTSITFDNHAGMMTRRLMGFLPVKVTAFEQLWGINLITSVGGGYSYRLFLKSNRYGKGIPVSSGYSKNDDQNATTFVNEVVPLIHKFLDQHAPIAHQGAPELTEFRYFNVTGGEYTLKKNKFVSLIIGLGLLFIGIHELSPVAWLGNGLELGRIFMLLVLLLGGPILILSAFTKVILDPVSKKVERISPIGLGNKYYDMKDFTGIQTIRKSTNFIYSGTDVLLYFQKADSGKEEGLTLRTFTRTRSIDRFVNEVNAIFKQSLIH